MSTLTPMLKQYAHIKKKHENAIVFFRLGDFYEMFGNDAVEASKILGITLTARNRGTENEIPMCGVPHHAAESYIAKLTRAGKSVAICDQITLPGKGLVERSVTTIVTPGTTLSPSALEEKSHNFIMALIHDSHNKEQVGFAIADIGTGEFFTNELTNSHALLTLIYRLRPREIITLRHQARTFPPFMYEQISCTRNTHTPEFGLNARESILEQFHLPNLETFGLENLKLATEASGLLISYIKTTQKTSLRHITAIKIYRSDTYLTLDQTTIRNLEILFTAHSNQFEGSLLSTLDSTKTAPGGRTLRQWLLHPLLDPNKIKGRLETVAFIKKNLDFDSIQKQLKTINDIERIVGKIGLQRANARDLVALKNSLYTIGKLKAILPKNNTPHLFAKIISTLDEHPETISLIEKALKDESPIETTEGNMFKDGYDTALDELRTIAKAGKEWLAHLAQKEQKRTGISSLKVKFNKIFGYYIEISNANLNKVPQNYIRKQTLVNAERFVTEDLKAYEEKILTAHEKMISREYELFCTLREKVALFIPTLQKTARALGALDVLVAFAANAVRFDYTQPEINENGIVEINAGRHPVIERLQEETYIPNDTFLDASKHVVLLTGPNMSGKSSYLRQVALIVLMAHIGSFVPADKANISITDRIFTRVGASDNLAYGQSTFMVEMQEAAHIIHNATSKSLIIIDELGRGTSTYDGLSIAWAVLEHIHNTLCAKTLFATHYHELIDLAEKLPRALNLSVAVTEHQGKIIFLHKIQKGGTPDSYGIEVAELAGLDASIIKRAKDVLQHLEDAHSGQMRLLNIESSLPPHHENFVSPQEKEVLEKLKKIDPNSIAPLESLEMLTNLVNALLLKK